MAVKLDDVLDVGNFDVLVAKPMSTSEFEAFLGISDGDTARTSGIITKTDTGAGHEGSGSSQETQGGTGEGTKDGYEEAERYLKNHVFPVMENGNVKLKAAMGKAGD